MALEEVDEAPQTAIDCRRRYLSQDWLTARRRQLVELGESDGADYAFPTPYA